MRKPPPTFELAPGAAAAARDLANRRLTPEEFAAARARVWTPEQEAEAREQITWFLRRYPTGAARLAKARRSYEQWARSIPREVLEAEERARDDETLAPGVYLELE